MDPYQQGQLDGYCGLYCLINSHHYVDGPIEHEAAWRHLSKLLEELNTLQPRSERIHYGTTVQELGMLFKYLEHDFNVHRYKPFHKGKVDRASFFYSLRRFLHPPNRVAMVCLSGKHNHWTLIKRVTEKRLYLFDSDGMTYLDKKHCSIGDSSPKSLHTIAPSHTYYLKHGEDHDEK